MVVKEYIERLKYEENYEEIKNFIKNYKVAKEEFLQIDAFRKSGWLEVICFGSLIIIVGLITVLKSVNIIIKGLYIIPFVLINHQLSCL